MYSPAVLRILVSTVSTVASVFVTMLDRMAVLLWNQAKEAGEPLAPQLSESLYL